MALGTHWIGSCVSPRDGLDDMEKFKFFLHYRDSNSGPSVVHPVVKVKQKGDTCRKNGPGEYGRVEWSDKTWIEVT
jgi:hypothetical protein